MRLIYSMTQAGKRRTRWSSLSARPVDVGDVVVFHPPFRCFASMRPKRSYAWISMKMYHKGGDDLWT
ncbi:hypothetical protein HNR34_001864 [Geobacillus subterraneus]